MKCSFDNAFELFDEKTQKVILKNLLFKIFYYCETLIFKILFEQTTWISNLISKTTMSLLVVI